MPRRVITKAVSQTFSTGAPGRKPSNMETPQAKQAGPQRCSNYAGWSAQAAASPAERSYKSQRSHAAEPTRAAAGQGAKPGAPRRDSPRVGGMGWLYDGCSDG